MNLELTRAVQRPGDREDLILQPEDSLHVPEYLPTVRVIGAVTSPTSVLYREGDGWRYYIDNAGGYARDADKERTIVRYANGSAGVRSKPGPGSTVSCPSGIRPTRLISPGFLQT